MSAFDKVIGYETIKKELMQICDMFRNKAKYEAIGATLLTGILISGPQGVGKTLLAECFQEESGVYRFTIDKSLDLCKYDSALGEIFEEARANASAVIFIDDLDDIAESICNELQVEMDNSQNQVLILAAVKDAENVPESLLRSGRFDRKIELHLPTEQECGQIFTHYLKDKKVKDINYEDLRMMCVDCSGADIKAIANEAAVNAVFSGRKAIVMQDFVDACLRREYLSPDTYTSVSEEDLRKTALHEAGHLVISEILCPESVGLVSLRRDGKDCLNGFVRRCKDLPRRAHDILVSLGGKAAVELYYAETCASGCYTDLRKAIRNIRSAVSSNGTCGIGMIDVFALGQEMSESMNARNEAVVQAELERYMFKARDILLKNRDFLEKATELLLEKRTLLHSDIKLLKESLTITDVAV